MSLLISYSTSVLRNYGAICKAFTLSDKSIYIIPSIYLSLKCCSWLFLLYSIFPFTKILLISFTCEFFVI